MRIEFLLTVWTIWSLPFNLADQTFTCGNGTAINSASLCDGHSDCPDGSDETYVERGFKCKLVTNKRTCVLPQYLLYDNTSNCIDGSDVCFDSQHKLNARNCFQCITGTQIVALSQVCDGIFDCDDLSDECLCLNNGKVQSNFVMNPMCSQICSATSDFIANQDDSLCSPCQVGEIKCNASRSFSDRTNGGLTSEGYSGYGTICVSALQLCDGFEDCSGGEDETFCSQRIQCKGTNITATTCDGVPTCPDFSDECESNCWHVPRYCDRIIWQRNKTDKVFLCNGVDVNATSYAQKKNVSLQTGVSSREVCNNIIDCVDTNEDEAFCATSTHFYCWSGSVLFTNQSRRFDEVNQCSDGSDECSGIFNSKNPSNYANENELIRNPILRTLVWIMAILALSGNIAVIVYTSKELWNDRQNQTLGRLAKCNRTFVLNLAVADLFMGFYLLLLGIEGVIKSNNYCANDRTWRSGRLCIFMGLFTQISSQTSVFLLLLMTSYRLFGTLHPFRVEKSKLLRGATFATFASWITSVSLALLTQTRFASEYFVDSYWTPLPFLNHDILNKSEMENLVLNIYTLTDSSKRLPITDLRWRTMIDYLADNNVTMMHPSWKKQKVVPIGYYNLYALCQPFFYPHVGDTAWLYMVGIVCFNFAAFLYIAFAYMVIYKASSRPCVRKSVRKRSKQWRRDNQKMQKKILCLVLTDMICWMPICIIMMLRLSGLHIHSVVHGVTSTVLLPINSALNPIVYSNIFNKIFNFVKTRSSEYQPASSSSNTSPRLDSIATTLSAERCLVDNLGTCNAIKYHSAAFSTKKRQGHVRFSYSSSKDSLFENSSNLGMGGPLTESIQFKKRPSKLLQNQRVLSVTAILEMDIKETSI